MEQSQISHGDDVEASIASGETGTDQSAQNGAVQKNLQLLTKHLAEVKMVEKAYLRGQGTQLVMLSAISNQLHVVACTLEGDCAQNDVGADRAELQNLHMRFNEMVERAYKQAIEYAALMARFDFWKIELTEQIEMLRAQSNAQRALGNEPATTQYAMTIEERLGAAVASSEVLTGLKEEFCKLQSDTDDLTKCFEQCKLSSE